MTDTASFIAQVERDLRTTRAVGGSTCEALRNLPPESRAALTPALAFLGCPVATEPPAPTRDEDRLAAVRLMLLKLGADSGDPRWSSLVLEQMVGAAATIPGSTPVELFAALYGLLGEFSAELTQPVANLVRELVVLCYMRFRPAYDAGDWSRFVRAAPGPVTAAQLYLLLHAMPPQHVAPDLAEAIARGLKPTPYRDEALASLSV